jgi:hypothetical protein
MAKGIVEFRTGYGDKVGAGYVVHPGSVRAPLGNDAMALPFADL